MSPPTPGGLALPLLGGKPASAWPGAQPSSAHRDPIVHTPRSSEDEQKHILRGPASGQQLEARGQRRDSPPARPGRGGGTGPDSGVAPARAPRSLHFRACAPRSLEAQLLAERGAPFFPEGARVQASGAPPTGVQTPALHPPAGPPESPWSLCGFAGSPGVGVGRASRDPANHVSTPERQNLPREPLVSAGAGVCGRSCRLGKSRGRGRREGSLRAPVCRGLSARLSCAVATGAAVGGRGLRASACLQLLSRPPQG